MQYFKPTTSNLEASLPTSVSKATILAVQKQLKARNTAEPTNNRRAYIKIFEEERLKLEAMLLRMESLLPLDILDETTKMQI